MFAKNLFALLTVLFCFFIVTKTANRCSKLKGVCQPFHRPCKGKIVLGACSSKKYKCCLKPVHCRLSPWSAWSECSCDCGVGTISRTRKVQVYPKYGGKPCSPNRKQSKPCNGTGTDCKGSIDEISDQFFSMGFSAPRDEALDAAAGFYCPSAVINAQGRTFVGQQGAKDFLSTYYTNSLNAVNQTARLTFGSNGDPYIIERNIVEFTDADGVILYSGNGLMIWALQNNQYCINYLILDYVGTPPRLTNSPCSFTLATNSMAAADSVTPEGSNAPCAPPSRRCTLASGATATWNSVHSLCGAYVKNVNDDILVIDSSGNASSASFDPVSCNAEVVLTCESGNLSVNFNGTDVGIPSTNVIIQCQ